MGLAGVGDDGGKFANWWHRHTGGGVRAKDCVPRATKGALDEPSSKDG
jgi:hypothetical protein